MTDHWATPGNEDELTDVAWYVIEQIAAFELTPEQRQVVLERAANHNYSYESEED
jgi:hypothetical protein